MDVKVHDSKYYGDWTIQECEPLGKYLVVFRLMIDGEDEDGEEPDRYFHVLYKNKRDLDYDKSLEYWYARLVIDDIMDPEEFRVKDVWVCYIKEITELSLKCLKHMKIHYPMDYDVIDRSPFPK
jgi:hypothetical protein